MERLVEEGGQAPPSSGPTNPGGASAAGGEAASYQNGSNVQGPTQAEGQQAPQSLRLRRAGAVGGWVLAAMAIAALIGTVRHTHRVLPQ